MSIAKTAFSYIAAQIRKELTIQPSAHKTIYPRGRKSASEKINENRVLKTGLNGIAMFVLICLGVAVLVF